MNFQNLLQDSNTKNQISYVLVVNKSISLWDINEWIEKEGVEISAEDYCSMEKEEVNEGSSRNQQPKKGLCSMEKSISKFWINHIKTTINGKNHTCCGPTRPS